MRRKKHKNTRRVVRFYKVHYSFRDPYKILLDGNFIHVTRLANLTNLDDHIPRLLGSACKLYVTPCVLAELKSLGPEYRDTVKAAWKYGVHKCGHDSPVAACDCLLQQTGSSNSNHWWVATQDQDLKKSLSEVPGCPCLFASVNGLHLHVPSDIAKLLAKQEEDKNQKLQPHEKKADALKELEELQRERRKDGSKSIFRRKRAKGPNPLAVRKKQKMKTPGNTSQQAKQKAVPTGTGNAGKNSSGAASVSKNKKRRRKTEGGAGASS